MSSKGVCEVTWPFFIDRLERQDAYGKAKQIIVQPGEASCIEVLLVKGATTLE